MSGQLIRLDLSLTRQLSKINKPITGGTPILSYKQTRKFIIHPWKVKHVRALIRIREKIVSDTINMADKQIH